MAAIPPPRPAPAGASATAALLVFEMWAAMSLAMMLPTAAPMVVIYPDLAETPAHIGERTTSPLFLIGG